ncbi:MAG: DUF1648 domain-containing protein [Corynebacterium sp.]|uniref:DUF1648 domain-containing protein n=1 Tax=Corynebacterium sp. TaxID=1720 RepID=UPI0026E062DC|nr:DUF1648 domain-containing protein [Corynebacterium sp.]MDO5671003.1 DUF1648 domain-containing protein [Corynebacterium sp.]
MSARTWYLGIPAVVAVCLTYLWMNFHLVPDPMPIHFGPRGEPDGWATKSFGSATSLIALGPGIMLLTGAASAGVTHAVAQDAGERQQMLSKEMNPPLAAWLFWIATIIAVGVTGSLLGHHGPLGTLLLVGSLVLVTVVFGWQMVRVYRRVDAAYPPTEKDRRGRWGFYYNPDDPEVLVSLENGMSTTLNFARPAAWAIIGGLLIVPALLIVLVAVAG